jgi:DNA-binding winged helix-turn-helix (wHTH) protein
MGSESGEAVSRGTLGDELWSGLEVTPAAEAGVRSRITMTRDGARA